MCGQCHSARDQYCFSSPPMPTSLREFSSTGFRLRSVRWRKAESEPDFPDFPAQVRDHQDDVLGQPLTAVTEFMTLSSTEFTA